MEDQIRRDPNVDAAMLELLNTKSEEIPRLESSLADERETGQLLMREISSLKANGNSQVADLQHQLEELRTALTEANAAKEAAVQTQVALEKDKEIILEQYRKASEFAMSIQKEKVEAEQRAEIAETQVKEAVPLIKRTYETRVQVLEAEARKWQQVSRFTVEREMRTNDEIRRRAAEEPELRRKIEELKAELENADLQWEESQKENRQLKIDNCQLEVEVAMWKQEVEKVKLERDANKGRVGFGSGESDQGFSEKDLVYYCRWKTEEGLQSCAEPFKTRTVSLTNFCRNHSSKSEFLQDLDDHIRLLGHYM
jgi:chromosome segregation ATPase